MGMNAVYRGPADCPAVIPVFPLPGALLLPRGQMPLNIFEPRYLAMVDDALKGDRIIGMIQPDADNGGSASVPRLYHVGCAGPHHAICRDRRRPLSGHAVGVARFRVIEELADDDALSPVPRRFRALSDAISSRAGAARTKSTARVS